MNPIFTLFLCFAHLRSKCFLLIFLQLVVARASFTLKMMGFSTDKCTVFYPKSSTELNAKIEKAVPN